jgi:hypothetical protein
MWEKVVRKMRAGAMPPAGVPHPDLKTQEGLVTWVETRLDLARPRHPGRRCSTAESHRCGMRFTIC